MTKDIGVGIVGLGMGRNMLEINSDRQSRMAVRAICDVNEELLKGVQTQHGIPFASTDYRELLKRDDISVVGIYTPDDMHLEHIEAALAAGKHVICTKPMVVSLDQAKRTVELVRKSGLKFLTGQSTRFVPEFMAAKKMYDDGDLGRPLFAEAHYVHDMRPVLDATPWRYQRPQDVMYGGSCHPIDLLRSFFGDVEEVFCYGAKSNIDPRYPWYDNFLINMRFRNGVIARVLAVFGLVEPPLPMLALGIYGDKGSMTNDTFVLDKIQGKPAMKMSFPREGGHGREVWRYMRHFEECIVEDKRPLIDEVEGAKVISTCSACWDSIHSGLPAKVFNDF